MIAAALALALAAGPHVLVDILAKEAPRSAVVSGRGRTLSLAARGDGLLVDGAPAGPVALAPGRWRVEVPGSRARVYAGALSARADGGVLRLRAELALDDYVAAVVASESLPGTPAAALEALAVVVRSYALASRERHADGVLCDLAHCQVLRGRGAATDHAAAAAIAARATSGEVLRLPSGVVAAAPFHAACGGHTADPVEVFGSPASGARAGPDPGCAPHPWAASLPAEAVGDALGRSGVIGPVGVDPPGLAVPVVLRGRGGWSVQVVDAGGGSRLSGDAFARALDASVGRGVVRSSRFELAAADGRIAVRGSGHGHGVGLCQEGAARRAAAGEDRRRILSHYFSARLAVMDRPTARPSASRRR